MKVLPYQLLLLIISGLVITDRTVRFFRRELHQSFMKYLSVLVIWIGIGVVSMYPELARVASARFGFGENLNTLIFIAFIVLFIILFKVLNAIEKTERNISEIIRNEALKELYGKSEKKKS